MVCRGLGLKHNIHHWPVKINSDDFLDSQSEIMNHKCYWNALGPEPLDILACKHGTASLKHFILHGADPAVGGLLAARNAVPNSRIKQTAR